MSKIFTNFGIDLCAFCYNDHEYFDWFKSKKKTIVKFKNILRWKGLLRSHKNNLNFVWQNRKNFDSYTNALVTKVFLKHLYEPKKFPILDRNVWHAMKNLSPKIAESTNKHPSNWRKDYFEGYKKFFDDLYTEMQSKIKCNIKINGVDKEIIKMRILDRALWEYGRMLNNNQ